ncbi:MAG TPA: glycosyltransferase family 9 protein [Bryobacteraceae bacterium]|nr:glycosyltransferase family 9 protein [Bryobacteraceae bacterium]
MAAEACTELLHRLLAGEDPPTSLIEQAMVEDEGRAMFAVVVERLADLFEPRHCDSYARLFARVLQITDPSQDADAIVERYGRVRQRAAYAAGEPETVVVLSRVTLGADVAVTSVVLNALHRRFPRAAICFAGPEKNFELFSGMRGLQHLPLSYPRHGGLKEKLSRRPVLTIRPRTLVIDPDSRLTQLGMLPVCPEENYVFFESRAYRADSALPLRALTALWTAEVFGEAGKPFVAPQASSMPCDVAVSFGTGGNPVKRVDGAFEAQLLHYLCELGLTVLLDGGAGGEETARARAAAESLSRVTLYEGPFAPFASAIGRARLYVGYDSAGAHVACATGTPAVCVFRGYPSERFLQRWRPGGPGRATVLTDGPELLARTCSSVDALLV